ncbi:MAG: hypothetical protein JO257_03340 [Deltaproteobacteria bacterium]|nr:hypothetical protein [Deltaproteobacteria bacterium]
MSDFQTEMDRVVQGFVSQITELARRAAIEMVEKSLGKSGARGSGRVALSRGRGAKRTSADLEQISSHFVSFVTKHPGLRIEQINKELGTSTKDLALPIRKLVADGVIKTKGKKRSTTYFAK